MAVALRNLLTQSSVSIDCKVDTFPGKIKRKTNVVIRVRVAYHSLVKFGDLSVSILVDELAITRLKACPLEGIGHIAIAVCTDVILEIRLILYDAFDLVAPEVTYRITDLYAI